MTGFLKAVSITSQFGETRDAFSCLLLWSIIRETIKYQLCCCCTFKQRLFLKAKFNFNIGTIGLPLLRRVRVHRTTSTSSAISIKHNERRQARLLEAQTTMPLQSHERLEGNKWHKHVEADGAGDSEGTVSELWLFTQCQRYL